jgi:hypothetical protein
VLVAAATAKPSKDTIRAATIELRVPVAGGGASANWFAAVFQELRASGFGFDRIAAILSSEGVRTRTPGKRWQVFGQNLRKRYCP